jgi:hypothetical protein
MQHVFQLQWHILRGGAPVAGEINIFLGVAGNSILP